MDKTIRTGQKAGIKWGKVKTDPDELARGLEIEKEHGSKLGKDTDITKDNPVTTARIAHAHLKENPRYYTFLDAMEKSAENSKGGNRRTEKRRILRKLIKSL
jgi:hypothetical protein